MPEGYVPLLPISLPEGEPVMCRQTLWRLMAPNSPLHDFALQPQYRPQNMCFRHCLSHNICKIKIPCTDYIYLKLGMYVVLEEHKIPETSFHLNSEFYSTTRYLR